MKYFTETGFVTRLVYLSNKNCQFQSGNNKKKVHSTQTMYEH